MIPDWKDEKLMGKVRKSVRYYETRTGEGNYNSMHENSLYEIEYHDGAMDQLTANIIAESMMSQVDSGVHQYRLLTEVTDQK